MITHTVVYMALLYSPLDYLVAELLSSEIQCLTNTISASEISQLVTRDKLSV